MSSQTLKFHTRQTKTSSGVVTQEPPIQREHLVEMIGQRLGEWVLMDILGEGGTSVVFAGRHLFHEQTVAIKLLHPELYEDEVVAQRFQREAEAIDNLNHVNIVDIHDFGKDPKYGYYMVLDMLEGLSLHDIIKRDSPLPLHWLLGISEQLCDALHTTHNAGIVHRDLKPSNIFLVPGSGCPTVKLLDFGTAKMTLRDNQTKLTHTGMVVGTPAYLSPEQLRDNAVLTPAADIYALAVIWFEALTGQLPIDAESQVEFFLKILQDEPKPLGMFRPEFHDTPLEDLILRMLSKNPEKRPSPIPLLWDEFEMACQILEDPFDTPDRYPKITKNTHDDIS